MNIKTFRGSLAIRLLVFIVLFSSTITLIGAALQLYIDYNKEVSFIKTEIAHIEHGHKYAISDHLWVFNRESLKIHLESLLTLYPDINYVEIITNDDESILLGQKEDDLLMWSIPISHLHRDKDVVIGNLYVGFTTKRAYDNLIGRIGIVLFNQFVNTFLVAGFIMILFYHLIGRHLKDLAHYTQKVDIDKLGKVFTLDRSKKTVPDELECVVFSINKMQSNLKKSIQNLDMSEKRYEKLLNNAPIGIYTIEAGMFTYANQVASHIFGARKDFCLIGSSIKDFLSSDSNDFMDTSHEGKEDSTLKIKNIRGEEVYISITSVNVASDDGDYCLVFAKDITDQFILEEDKKKLTQRLTQSQKMESIGTLVGGIAHDFNNILTGILGFSELLKASVKDENHKIYASHVVAASNRAKDLIDQMMTFCRNSEEEKKNPLHLHVLVKEIIKLLRSSTPSTIEFKRNINMVDSIYANPTQLHQVLMNLCTNAISAIGEDEIGTLEIELEQVILESQDVISFPHIEEGEYVKLTVRDTGHGMTEATIDRIFEPFFTTKDLGKGTGMGLATVYSIIMEHKGEIVVYSEPNKGSTFTVYLPITDKENLPTIKEEEDNLYGNETILLVDDEDMLLDMGKYSLSHFGYKIVTTSSPHKAIDLFTSDPKKFDLVLTDQLMPKMTGAELATRLLSINPDIPIILYTGYSRSETSERLKEVGLKTILMKPVAGKDIARAIREIMDA